MPTVNWGIAPSDVDSFDRDSQFKPYGGPRDIPLNVVYAWRIASMKFLPATKDKNVQWRVTLVLVPREGFDEDQYNGFPVTDFIPITPSTNFRYTPLLDALGVTGSEFAKQTKTDTDGKVIRIGKWKNSGDTIVVAQLIEREDNKGKMRFEIAAGSYGDLPNGVELSDLSNVDDDDDDEFPDDDEFGEDTLTEDYEDDDKEEERPRGRSGSTRTAKGPRRRTGTGRTARTRGTTQRKTTKARRTRRDPNYDDDMGF